LCGGSHSCGHGGDDDDGDLSLVHDIVVRVANPKLLFVNIQAWTN
jgi:hypothetical protein